MGTFVGVVFKYCVRVGECDLKLIVAIVQDNDVDRLAQALGEESFRSTKLASTGGFLKRGNTTIMVGCDEALVGDALEIIRVECSERLKESSSAYPMRANMNLLGTSGIEVGGATVFVLPVEGFYRL